MNVLFLSQVVPYPPHGGVLQRGYHILRQLSRRARVHLLAFVHPNLLPTPEKVEESRRALGDICATVDYFPLWVKRSMVHQVAGATLAAVSSSPFGVIAHRSPAYRTRVSSLLARERFDVVHVDTIALDQFIDHTARPPALLTHHNIESTLMARRASVQTQALARRFFAREAGKLAAFERRAAGRYDVNIVVSEADGRALTDLVPGARTAVVPNGVDVEYFAPSTSAPQPAFVYTGGLTMFANLDAVMYFIRDIWPRIVARRPDARFHAVGRNPPQALREAAVADPRIVVPGYVDDIRPLVGQSAVYVVPAPCRRGNPAQGARRDGDGQGDGLDVDRLRGDRCDAGRAPRRRRYARCVRRCRRWRCWTIRCAAAPSAGPRARAPRRATPGPK